MTSSSRGVGSGCSSLAKASRRLVSPAMAEGTTTSWWPSRANRATRLATSRMLFGLDALANHDLTLSRAEFHQYVAALDLGRRLPGVQAVEFIRRVPESARDAFVASVRNDRSLTNAGYPGFGIHPAEHRDEHWV